MESSNATLWREVKKLMSGNCPALPAPRDMALEYFSQRFDPRLYAFGTLVGIVKP
jgi:hypothetical protein